MCTYEIFSDSSCDIPVSLIEEYDINLVSFYITFDQSKYFKENEEISNEEFYHTLITQNVFPKTSLPSVMDYFSRFEEALKNGKDILCFCLSSQFSGSYQSAVNAKNLLLEQYPDSNIEIVDSIQATAGQGLVVLQAAYMRKDGLTLEETLKNINILKSTARIMFTVDSLEYLFKGGRIGKVTSLAGTMLNIKPMIQMRDGELIPYCNVRGRKKSLLKAIDMMKEYFHETGESYDDYDFCLAYATTMEDILFVQDALEKEIGRKITYPLFQIGVTIGTNTGPTAIGVTFIKKYQSS